MNRFIKLTAAFAAAALGVTANAYTFPERDLGAVLKERETMVAETDFELYTEADTSLAPYYGARLEPRGGAYIGMVTETSEPFAPVGGYLTYIDNLIPWIYRPANTMIRDGNSVATVALNITTATVDFDKARRVLEMLKGYNKPMLIRFAGEMSESAIGDDPEEYIRIFRRMADMVHEYENFAMVWSPLDLGNLYRPYELYYPGDEYVDWVGVSSYEIKYFQGEKNTSYNNSVFFMTGDNSWATNRIKPFMKFLEENNINKPVMISEAGVSTENQYGEDLETWAKPRLRNLLWSMVMKYPQIKLINYFNVKTKEKQTFYISDFSYASDIFKEAAASGAYIRSADGKADFIFRPAAGSGSIAVPDGRLPLYTLAYIKGKPEVPVTYSVDGSRVGTVREIPYKFELDITGLSDGAHSIAISADELVKTYTIQKKGMAVSFAGEAREVMRTASADIRVVLNAHTLMFEQPPVIENGNTLVPMRAIFEELGCSVSWDGVTQTITAERGGDSIVMGIGNNTMTVTSGGNKKSVQLEVPPALINGYTMVPVRAIAESLGCSVKWDGNVRTVFISDR